MAWINVHQELRKHPKARRLAESLGIHRAHAVGLLVDLWLWCMSYAPHGDINNFSDGDIKEAADWEGDPQKFSRALRATQWVDPDGKLHDWDEFRLHFDSFQEKQERTREQGRLRVQNWRERKKKELDEKRVTSEKSNVTVTRDVTLHYAPENRIEEKSTRTPPLPPKGGQGMGGPAVGGKDKGGPLQEVVDGFTISLDQNIADPNWQKVYGRSIARHSKKLLTLFEGDAGKALDCIEGVIKHAKARRWSDWTPKTIVDRAGDWKAGRLAVT